MLICDGTQCCDYTFYKCTIALVARHILDDVYTSSDSNTYVTYCTYAQSKRSCAAWSHCWHIHMNSTSTLYCSCTGFRFLYGQCWLSAWCTLCMNTQLKLAAAEPQPSEKGDYDRESLCLLASDLKRTVQNSRVNWLIDVAFITP